MNERWSEIRKKLLNDFITTDVEKFSAHADAWAAFIVERENAIKELTTANSGLVEAVHIFINYLSSEAELAGKVSTQMHDLGEVLTKNLKGIHDSQ